MHKLLLTGALLAGGAAAEPGTARVYIFAQAPALPSNPLWCDGVRTAQLRPDRFIGLNLSPGRHSFSFSGRRRNDQITIELTAGKTYYLRLDRVFPYAGGPPSQSANWYDQLTRLTAQDAGKILNTLEATQPKDIFAPEHVTLDRTNPKP